MLRSGLVICALLAALDIVGLSGFAADDGPPAAVMIVGAVLGVVTLVVLRPALGGGRGALATVGVSRVVSALLGAGVFFADNAPTWAKVVVTVAIGLTVVGLALAYGAQRDQASLSTV